MEFNQMRKITESLRKQRSLAIDRLLEAKRRKRKAKEEATGAAEAVIFVQEISKSIQRAAHQKIATLVSKCLAAIFDEPYEFKINFESKRGRTEATLSFIRNGVAFDPISSTGGGVVQLAAFALRLSCLLASSPPPRRLLVLDEPFNNVSSEYRGKVRDLLETLADELNFQFIIITHHPEYELGTTITL